MTLDLRQAPIIAVALASLAVSTALAQAEDAPPRIVGITPSPTGGIVDQIGLGIVEISFSEPVLIGGDPLVAWGVGSGEIPVSTTYDALLHRLTVTFAPVVKGDRLTLSILQSITDLSGQPLDGEIVSPTGPILPSGDGLPGGPATFRFDVLQGDADGDGLTNAFDIGIVLDGLGSCVGDAAFAFAADLNNDGCVNALDIQIVLSGQGGMLPPLDGAPPTIVSVSRPKGAPLTEDLDDLAIKFNEELESLSVLPGSVVMRSIEGDVFLPESTVLAADGRTIDCHFSPPLSSCGNYSVWISSGISDLSGELFISTAPAGTFIGSTPPTTPILNDYIIATTAAGVTISGTIPSLPGFAGAVEIRIQGPDEVVTTAATSAFSVVMPLKADVVNNLYVSAISPCGIAGAPVVAQVTRDITPPNLTILFPADGSMFFEESVNVGGLVGDTLIGFEGLSVTVNGQRAVVDIGVGQNGTWIAPDVALGPPGVATPVSVVASDVLGNSVTKSVTLTRQARPEGVAIIESVSGDDQVGVVNADLPLPIRVRVLKPNGKPWANKLVDFHVVQNDGRLSGRGFGSDTMLYQALTDAAGEAAATWKIGSSAGCGNNRVEATASGVVGTVLFSATALAAVPDQINIGSGNNQRVEVGAPTPHELTVWVSDSCNPVSGVPVTFTVTTGGGLVNGRSVVTIASDATGHAEVDFAAGPLPGANRVEANYPGNKTNPAVFTTYGIARDYSKPTSFSGLVLDNANRPIGKVKISLKFGTTIVGPVFTNPQGQFELTGFEESGSVHVIVEGFFANTLNGEPLPAGVKFPSLGYDAAVVPNAANTLGRPILLPPMLADNTVTWNGQSDITLECAGIDGLKFTLKADSMTLENGSKPTPGAPVKLSLNQVHHDDVPMPMPDGVGPAFAWTFQPPAATFNPPVAIEYPNMSVLPPGATAYFLTFNHDLGAFEIVAPGTVTDDGSMIVTPEGTGLTLSGWGCNCPPYAVTADCCNATPTVCSECEDGQLVAKPNGVPCDDNDPCTENDICQSGVCKGTPVAPPGGPLSVPLTTNGWPVNLLPSPTAGNFAKATQVTLEGSVYLDQSASVLRYQLGTANLDGFIEISTSKYIEPTPAVIGDCPPILPGTHCYCTIVNSLGMYVPCGTGPFQPVAATTAHEQYHRTDDYPNYMAPYWQAALTKINELAVGCDKPPAEAAALLKKQAKAIAAQAFKDMQDSSEWKMFLNVHNKCKSTCSCTQGAYSAGDAVNQAQIQVILAIAAGAGFAPCPPSSPPPLRRPGPDPPSLDVVDITLTASSAICAPGGQSLLNVTATLADGGQVDITNHSRLSIDTSDATIAQVLLGGMVSCLAPGDVTILVSFLGDGDEPWCLPMQDLVQLRVTSDDDPDGDLMPSEWERMFGLDPNSGADANVDSDNDGLSNQDEFMRGTDPTGADSDGDGVSDGAEVKAGTSPTDGIRVDGGWTLTINGQTTVPNADGTFFANNITAPDQWGAGGPGTPPDFVADDQVSVIGVGVVDGYTRYVSSAGFTITQGQATTVPALTITNIPPQGPTSIVLDGSASVVAVGGSLPLHVTAVLNNGLTEDATSARSGTTYRTTSPARATVSADGVVTGHQPGTVFITAINSAAVAVKRIDVTAEGLSTVITGTVVRYDGIAVADAEVTSTFGGSAASSGDGTFVLPMTVPIRAAALVVQASAVIGGTSFIGSKSLALPGVAGAIDAGDVTLFPIEVTSLYGPAQIAVGDQPVDVTLVDVNGDGRLDLVTANAAGGDVSVHLGLAGGGFGDGLFFTMGAGVRETSVGDINGDGIADLSAVISTGLVLRLGVGDGSFGLPVTVALGDSPVSLALADLDGDGDVDVAASNPGTDTVTIALNDGRGTFGKASSLDFGNSPGRLVATDIDADGDIDLVAANFDNDRITVRRNRGGASFSAAEPILVGDGPTDLVFANLNEDSAVDLAVSNYWSNDITVRLADGSGSFGEAVSLASGDGPTGLVAADLDLDGDVDLASCHEFGGTVGIHLNRRTGIFAPVVLEPAGASPSSVAVGDENVDGWPDLFVANATTDTVTVIHGHRGGDFGSGNLLGTNDTPVAVASADLNGDGFDDLVVANEGADGISVHLGDGAGGFATAVFLPMGESPQEIVAADVDDDGDIDLLTVHPGSDAVVLRRRMAGATWGNPELIPMGEAPAVVVVADINGDGRADLVTANPDIDALNMRLGLTGGGFGPIQSLVVADGPRGVVAADFDNDGDMDLATANYWDKSVSVLINDGIGGFTTTVRDLGVRPIAIHAADLSGDGSPELMVSCTAADQVHLLYSDGTGAFSKSVIVPTAKGPRDAIAGDMDGDGDVDLLIACGESGVVALHLAAIDGTLNESLTFITAPHGDSIAAADFNGDGRLDLAATAPMFDAIALLLQMFRP